MDMTGHEERDGHGKCKLTSITGILLFRVVPVPVPVPLARRLNCIDIGMISRSNPVRPQLSISLHNTVITCSSLITPCLSERPVNGLQVPCWGMTMLAVSFACKITTCTTEPGPGNLLDLGKLDEPCPVGSQIALVFCCPFRGACRGNLDCLRKKQSGREAKRTARRRREEERLNDEGRWGFRMCYLKYLQQRHKTTFHCPLRLGDLPLNSREGFIQHQGRAGRANNHAEGFIFQSTPVSDGRDLRQQLSKHQGTDISPTPRSEVTKVICSQAIRAIKAIHDG